MGTLLLLSSQGCLPEGSLNSRATLSRCRRTVHDGENSPAPKRCGVASTAPQEPMATLLELPLPFVLVARWLPGRMPRPQTFVLGFSYALHYLLRPPKLRANRQPSHQRCSRAKSLLSYRATYSPSISSFTRFGGMLFPWAGCPRAHGFISPPSVVYQNHGLPTPFARSRSRHIPVIRFISTREPSSFLSRA